MMIFMTVPATGTRFFLRALPEHIAFAHCGPHSVGWIDRHQESPLVTTVRDPTRVAAGWLARGLGDLKQFVCAWTQWAEEVMPRADLVLSVDHEPQRRLEFGAAYGIGALDFSRPVGHCATTNERISEARTWAEALPSCVKTLLPY